jgi:hypothetical protein
MKAFQFRRPAIMVGVIGVAMIGATLLAPAAAQANVQNPPLGSQPGNLTLSPASGATSVTPTFASSTACPVGNQLTAGVVVVADDGTKQGVLSAALPSATISSPFTGTFGFSLADVLSVAGPAGETYEIVVDCRSNAAQPGLYTQSTFVTFSANGLTYTTSPTPPGPGATSTTTTLNVNPTTGIHGSNVTMSATVSPTAAAGNVEFFDGTDSLGTAVVASGHASKVVNTLQVGDHAITAKFEPTNAAAFTTSTSAPTTVTVTASTGDTGSETINVNVPLSEGVFTITVSPGAVQLTDAVNNGTFFESTGSLSPVTVSDARQQSKPGWSVSGQVSDFASGAKSFVGNKLGWTPQITSPNNANDVTAGAPIAAGATPGLKQGGALASALASHGFGTTVLGAALDLQIPVDTAAGAYSAVLTVTAVEHA